VGGGGWGVGGWGLAGDWLKNGNPRDGGGERIHQQAATAATEGGNVFRKKN